MPPDVAHFKDQVLDRVARTANVAQFVSFDPNGGQRFAWIQQYDPNHVFSSDEASIGALFDGSPEGSVNVRSFEPHNPKSREFLYGLKSLGEAVSAVRRLAGQGLYTIVNETVDVNDGGVSGVAFGDVVEFAPGDTPRCVEKGGTAAFPREAAMRLFNTVYGFVPALPDDAGLRVEFSLHPLRRGYRRDHTIVWETEGGLATPQRADPVWPNHFSRAIGDKAFGLLVAWLNGFNVPRTIVVARRLAPFGFGIPTGSGEPWIRTCPIEQDPGRFTTSRGWIDPFRLLHDEDPSGAALASVLHQEGVDAVASGAALSQADGTLLVEGVRGAGDKFMVGRPPEALAEGVHARVRETYDALSSRLGAVRFEWVDDGQLTWIVQLHRGRSASVGGTIFPGTVEHYIRFPAAEGLEALRALIPRARGERAGIVLVGHVGITSHFGDVLRRAEIPSRMEAPEA